MLKGFSEARQKVRRKFTELTEKDRSLPKKLVGTRQDQIVKSRSLPGVRRMVSESLSEDRRKFAESSPEEVLTYGLCNSLENVFKFIVSTLIRARIRCLSYDPSRGQFGPSSDWFGPILEPNQ